MPHLRSRDPLHRGGQVFIPNSWPSPPAAGSRSRARRRRYRPARKGPCGRRTFWVEVSSPRASERARRLDPIRVTSGHARLGRLTSTRRARAASGPMPGGRRLGFDQFVARRSPARPERPWRGEVELPEEAGRRRRISPSQPKAWKVARLGTKFRGILQPCIGAVQPRTRVPAIGHARNVFGVNSATRCCARTHSVTGRLRSHVAPGREV